MGTAKLLKIIMIHGHLPGVVELSLDGHTNICGSNASGKTTLQRMIPVFYGELPNKVVPRTRLSFDKYYLPYKNSYVIYEYQRPYHGLAQVVLTKRVDGIDYRFVDGPYQPEHYLLEKKSGVVAREYRDWGQEMRSLGVEITAKMSSTTEYRNIILNDIKSARSNSRENIRHRQLASRYGLVQDKYNLRHIEKLVSAVHAKEGKMSTLKSMLAAILEEDGYQHPSNTMTGEKIRHWLRDIKQFMKMEELQQSLFDIERVSAGHKETLAVLWYLKSLVDNSVSQQQQVGADTEADIQALKRDMSTVSGIYEQERSRLREQKNDAIADLEKSQRQLKSAQTQYDAYRDQDMERIGRELAQLPERRNEQQGLEQHYQRMTAAHQGVKQELHTHQLQLAEQQQQANNQFQAKIKEYTAQQQQCHLNELEATKALNTETQRQQMAVRTQYEKQLTQLQNERVAKQAQIGLSTLNAEELEQQNLAEQRLEQAQIQQDEQAKLVYQQQRDLTAAQRVREQKAQDEKEARSAVAQGELHLEQLRQRLEPPAGSLQHFLSQNIEHWQYSFGRVLAEPLLQRTDLAPHLIEPESLPHTPPDVIFGVQLDLHPIELSEYALSEERMRDHLEQASEQWQRQKIQFKDIENELAKAVEQVKHQQQALDVAEQQLRNLRKNVEFAREHKQGIAHEHQQLEQKRKKAIRQRIQQLDLQLEKTQQEQQAVLEELADEQAARAIAQTAEFQKQQQILQDTIDYIEQEKARLDDNYQQQKNDLEQAFSAKLAEQGVDEHKLARLKQQIEDCQRHIQNIDRQRDTFNDYQQFMKVTWQGLRLTWLNNEQSAQQQLRVVTAALKQHEAQYKAQQQKKSTQLAQLNEQLEKAKKQLKNLQSVISRMVSLPSTSQEPSPTTAAGLARGDVSEQITRSHQLLDEQQQLDKRLADEVNSLEANIRKDSDQSFVRFMEEVFSQLGEAPDRQARINALTEIINVLEAKQQQILKQGRTIGDALFKFFTVFNDIHRRVSDYSRRLTQAVGDELTLDGIDKAEVKISSTIDELSFWQPLKEMIYYYRQWQAPGELIPSSEYLEYLSDVAELLRGNQEYSIESLLKLQLNLTENGESVVIRNDRQLTDSSSNGMAYLILCKFLLAFTRLLRPEAAGVTLHWPIDEIGTLAYHNVEKLFAACDHNNINIVGAFPNAESEVLLLFKHRYLIEPHLEQPNKGQLKRIKPRVSELSKKLQELQSATKPQETQV